MGRSVPLLAALLAAACTGGEPAEASDARPQILGRLAKMTGLCGVPERTLVLTGPDQVTMRTGPDLPWPKVECLIDELNKADPKLRYMFMGNAPYKTENKQ